MEGYKLTPKRTIGLLIFLNPNSHPNCFYWGHQCSWTHIHPHYILLYWSQMTPTGVTRPNARFKPTSPKKSGKSNKSYLGKGELKMLGPDRTILKVLVKKISSKKYPKRFDNFWAILKKLTLFNSNTLNQPLHFTCLFSASHHFDQSLAMTSVKAETLSSVYLPTYATKIWIFNQINCPLHGVFSSTCVIHSIWVIFLLPML